MSNFLAIAATTATLCAILRTALGSGAEVKHNRPDGKDEARPPDHGVNVFLYQVTPNAAFRSYDLPTRGASGGLMARPTLGLELHYLLTFHGEDSLLEPQRFLGKTLTALHTQPELTATQIQDATDAFGLQFPESELNQSNLHLQIEGIRFTPLQLSLEETSKVWSVMLQTPYALSVCYQASVILLEADEEPGPTMPVFERNIQMSVAGPPSIADVEIATSIFGSGQPFVVVGQNLSGTAALLGNSPAIIETGSTATRALVAPGADARAGKQEVFFELPSLFGVGHAGKRSNSEAVVLHPALSNASVGANTLSVDIAPSVGPDQDVSLIVSRNDGSRQATIDLPPRSMELDKLDFPLDGLPAGTYRIRVTVDGAFADGGEVAVP